MPRVGLRDGARFLLGDNGPASSARLNNPTGVAMDSAGSEVVGAGPPVNRGRPREWGRNRQAPVRSTGVLGRACRKGDLGNWGRSGAGGDRISNVVFQGDGQPGSRRGS